MFRYILIFPFFLLMFCKGHAQEMDENTYKHKINLIDSLSLYKMKDYDTLYHVSASINFFGRDYKDDYYGWIKKCTQANISFINTDGTEIEFEKKEITAINSLPITDSTIAIFVNKTKDLDYVFHNFGKNYLLNSWLYKKGKINFSKELIPLKGYFFSDNDIRDSFGIIYYDAMLGEMSYYRNYSKAIEFGDHLSNKIFNGYEYQKEAIELTHQLKNNTDDFKTFRIPDSLEWSGLKLKLTRNQQIIYLADRLRLLNCIQSGQPGGINYDTYQYSISYIDARKLNISYWQYNAKYEVINPFVELLKMKLNVNEAELILPYLLTGNYIASYSYFRDFRPQRTLHRLSWVTHDLIYEITNQRFFSDISFDTLSFDQKKAVVQKIKEWCDQNAALSGEALTVKILKTTDKWSDFNKALETAREKKYRELLPIIVERFNDFKGGAFPISYKGYMAETMFEIGNEKYIGDVKNWSKDTTDTWVNLWSSLFLLKYDKYSYDSAMNELETILKQDDGTFYYPHAMDLLLSMNDNRALKLAEGILDKRQFPSFIYWDYYLNFIKRLLQLKSNYTFNFLNKKLGSFTQEEIDQLNSSKNIMVQSDSFVLAVDKLKDTKPGYDMQGSVENKLAYKKALSEWFNTQYNLLKMEKPNELNLNPVKVNQPVTFVDSPRYN